MEDQFSEGRQENQEMQQRSSTMNPFGYIEACIARQGKVDVRDLTKLAAQRYRFQFLGAALLGFVATLFVWFSDVDVSSGTAAWASDLNDRLFWSFLTILVACQCVMLAIIQRSDWTTDAQSHRVIWDSSFADFCVMLHTLWLGLLFGVLILVLPAESRGYSAPQSIVSFVTALNPEFEGVSLGKGILCAARRSFLLLAAIGYMRFLTINGIFGSDYKDITRILGFAGLIMIFLLVLMLWQLPSGYIEIYDMPYWLLTGALVLGGTGYIWRGHKSIDVRAELRRAFRGFLIALAGFLLLGIPQDQQGKDISAVVMFSGIAACFLPLIPIPRWWFERKKRGGIIRFSTMIVQFVLMFFFVIFVLLALQVSNPCRKAKSNFETQALSCPQDRGMAEAKTVGLNSNASACYVLLSNKNASSDTCPTSVPRRYAFVDLLSFTTHIPPFTHRTKLNSNNGMGNCENEKHNFPLPAESSGIASWPNRYCVSLVDQANITRA